MSSIGNIHKSYGSSFNIGVANTYSSIVLSGSNLPKNSIIISSPVDDDYEDIGTYSLLVTDYNGEPVRLTYTIKVGNGLDLDSNNKDILYLNIDEDFIKYDSSTGLYVDLSSILPDTIYVNSYGRLSVNINNIGNISDTSKGTITPDQNTIIKDEDKIYVNTSNLILSNNSTGQYGIVSSSDNMISIDNGKISINENNFPLAEDDEFGFGHGDEYTIFTKSDSSLYVNTSNLDKATNDTFGIIEVDNDKVNASNGVLSINTENLVKANYNKRGIISIDGDTIILNDSNQISINNYSDIYNNLDTLNENIIDLKNKFDNLKEEILTQING